MDLGKPWNERGVEEHRETKKKCVTYPKVCRDFGARHQMRQGGQWIASRGECIAIWYKVKTHGTKAWWGTVFTVCSSYENLNLVTAGQLGKVFTNLHTGQWFYQGRKHLALILKALFYLNLHLRFIHGIYSTNACTYISHEWLLKLECPSKKWRNAN